MENMEQQNDWKSLTQQEQVVFKKEYDRKSYKQMTTLSSDNPSEKFLDSDFDYDAES